MQEIFPTHSKEMVVIVFYFKAQFSPKTLESPGWKCKLFDDATFYIFFIERHLSVFSASVTVMFLNSM